MRKILFGLSLLASILSTTNSYAEVVSVAKCNFNEIVYDTDTGDYMYTDDAALGLISGTALIYGDEGRTKVIKNDETKFHVRNVERLFIPLINPDGHWRLPFETYSVEIEIDKTTGNGSVTRINDDVKSIDLLVGCE